MKARDNESLWWSVIEPLQSEIRFNENDDKAMLASLTAGQKALLASTRLTEAFPVTA